MYTGKKKKKKNLHNDLSQKCKMQSLDKMVNSTFHLM